MRCENAIIISMRYFGAKTARARRSEPAHHQEWYCIQIMRNWKNLNGLLIR